VQFLDENGAISGLKDERGSVSGWKKGSIYG
jgi:hypothetical protein